MSVKLDMFDGNGLNQLSSKKLYKMLSGYEIVAEHFNPKNISHRINAKIYNGTICVRSKNARKRGPRIKNFDNLYLEIGMIFTMNKNARLCSDQIEKYILSQRSFFFSEVQDYLEYAEFKNKEEEKVINAGYLKITSDGSVVTVDDQESVSTIVADYDLELAKKHFLILKKSNLYKTNTSINQSTEISSISTLQNLFLLIASLIFLIIYRKVFKKKLIFLKNKLLSVTE